MSGQRLYVYVKGEEPHKRVNIELVGNFDGTPPTPVASYDGARKQEAPRY
jgi:hypothetical protein